MYLEEFKETDASTLSISKLITMIARGNTIYLNHHLEDLGINASQLYLLFEISYQKNVNQEKIASRCNINKGAVARSIKKLEEMDLVKREIDDENRRQNKVSLTPKGEKTLNDSTDLLDKWEDEVFSNDTIDKKTLQEVLKEIAIKTMELNQKESKNG